MTDNRGDDDGPTDKLLYASSSGWSPLPPWARFFVALGRAAVRLPASGQRLVIAVAVPTREFAAAFVALGAVEARVAYATGLVNDNFDELCGLTKGDKVTVLQAGKKFVASFERAGSVGGRDGIFVIFDKDCKSRMTNFLPREECGRVAIGALGRDRLPTVAPKRDAPTHHWDERFVESALGIESASEYTRNDDFTALIVGQVQSLRFELEEAMFAIPTDDAAKRLAKGHIEDLIRTKKFATDVEGETFRTEVMSDRSRELDPELARLSPPVVVFDGANAFSKHSHAWRSATWVAILDRTSAHTEDAAAALGECYISQRLDDTDPLKKLEPPPGIELSAFVARVNS